jgi:hypothetical protein
VFDRKKYKISKHLKRKLHIKAEDNTIGQVYINTTTILVRKFWCKDLRTFLLEGDYHMHNLCVMLFTNVKYKFAQKSSIDFVVQAAIVYGHSRTKP